MTAQTVLVTALQHGYDVRTTVRSVKRAESVRKVLVNGGASEEQAASVQFFAADLTSDDGWEEAVAGCDYVLHVASPYPSTIPKNEDEVIIPAREGTLRALRAAKKAGTVKRVFLTSSFASVGYGYAQSERTKENPFTEKDWTRAEGAKSEVGAYEKSKALAEKAAWEWLEKEGEGMEMATVNPVGVFGPVIGGGSSTSLELPTRLLNGQLPGLPDLSFGVVDVRDVASLHLLAMKSPQAAGQRYLAISDELSVSTKEIAEILKSGLPAADSKKVPTRMLPSWLLKIVGHFDSTGALIAPELGGVRPKSNARAKQELAWRPSSAREAIVDSAKSLKQYGFVKT